MGTRGIYGFRKNGVDKLSYNRYDSYPDYLGEQVCKFCAGYTLPEMNDLFDKIVMVDESAKPTNEQIGQCMSAGLADLSVSTQKVDDWYCLLRNAQGDLTVLDKLVKSGGVAYMIDNQEFIKDSLFCEFGYIINLDTNMLEFWVGFQREPQEGNRYGEEQEDGYYPCALKAEFPLDGDFSDVVDKMNKISD